MSSKGIDGKQWESFTFCACAKPEKVHSAWRWCTGTPGWTWICAGCREFGTDWTHNRPETVDQARFVELTPELPGHSE